MAARALKSKALAIATLSVLTACSPGLPNDPLPYTETPDFCPTLIAFGQQSLVEADHTGDNRTAEEIIEEFALDMLESDVLINDHRFHFQFIRDQRTLNLTGAHAYEYFYRTQTMLNQMADACNAEPTAIYTGTEISPAQDLDAAIEFCETIDLTFWRHGVPSINPELFRSATDSLPIEFRPFLRHWYLAMTTADQLDAQDADINHERGTDNAWSTIVLDIHRDMNDLIGDYCDSVNPND